MWRKTIPAGPVGFAIAILAAERVAHELLEQSQRNMVDEMHMRREEIRRRIEMTKADG
jgi:2-methylisocitrate lyase-like PEP mutase family enzyme